VPSGAESLDSQDPGENVPQEREIDNINVTTFTADEGTSSTGATKAHNVPMQSKKRKRRTSPLAASVELDSGDPLDPTTITMKDLCGETSFGRVSSRHVEVQEAHIRARKTERERRAQLAKIREAKEKRGEDLDNPDTPLDMSSATQLLTTALEATAGQEDFDYGENLKTSHFTVAMRMDASGQMVPDEESLLVDRGADPALAQDESVMEHVEETDISRFVNSASHSRKLRGSRWTREETELYYEVRLQLIHHQSATKKLE
jgi:transcription factor TFIIIB component B''